MKLKEIVIAGIFFVAVTILFFYKVFFFGYVPVPGDLLVAEYGPWKAHSYLGYVPGSFPEKAQYFDILRQLYPWKTFSIDLFKAHQLPFWNSHNFSGSPLLANFQSAVFYPLNIFYFLFSQIRAWSLLIIFQSLLGAFFTYLFARKIGIGNIGSVLSSIAFSYSLFSTVFLEYNTIGHTIAWLPLSLYLVEKMLEKVKPLLIILFVASLTFAFLAGHIQIASFVWLFIFIYIIFRIGSQSWTRDKKVLLLGVFFGLFLLALGTSSLQLFPTMELINVSARVAQSYQFLIDKLLLQPYQGILFLSPDFFGNPATGNYLISDTYPGNAVYVGIVTLILALFAFVKVKTSYFVRFFFVATLVLLCIFIRSPLTELFYHLQIPFFSTGSPTNGIFLLSFSLSVLAGFGIDQWLKKNEESYKFVVVITLLIFLTIWLGITLLHPQAMSVKNFLYSTAIFAFFLVVFAWGTFFPKQKKRLIHLLLFLVIFDLFYFFQKFNPFVPQDLVFPSSPIITYLKENGGINRFWGYGGAAVEANFATQYQLFSPDGYDPLYPRRYGEFIQSSKNGKIQTEFNNQSRSDAVIAPGFGEKDLISNKFRLRILDALGVKYILKKQEEVNIEKTLSVDRFKLLYEKDGWQIFENLKASPRAFLATDYKKFQSLGDFEKLFFSDSFDAAKTILLEEVLPQSSKNSTEQGLVSVNSYSPNSSVFTTQGNTDAILFLSDTYYPGWKAFVDGKESPIYRADYAFRAVLVPAGEHTVVFHYQPQSFILGVKTTIISLITLILFASFIRGILGKRYEK